VAVKIRLKRLGKIRVPQYRIVVVDSRKKRDGRVIEEIGKYHPKEDPSYIDVVTDRAQYWLGVGAQPTEAVEQLLKITGDWQRFKGLPGTEGTLKVKEPKRDKLEIFNEALKDAASEPKAEAVTRRAAKKAAPAEEAPAAEVPVAPEAPVAPVAAEQTVAEETPAAETAVEQTTAEESAVEEAPAEDAPAPVPADETPEGAAEAAEAAEAKSADGA
jgi:small subunit ribosomal protein S16